MRRAVRPSLPGLRSAGAVRAPLLTRFTVPAALVVAAALALAFPANPSFWDALNRGLPVPPDPRVVVVGIDAATLADYGRLDTWDRALYARALDTLDAAGARAVGLDVLLGSPASGDLALDAALSRRPVVLATSPDDPQGLLLGPRLSSANRAVTGVSALNIAPDGLVRSVQRAYALDGGPVVASFSGALAGLAGGSAPRGSSLTAPQTLRAPDPAHPIPVLSFRDVVAGTVRYSALQGKVVVVGVTAPGGALPLDVARQQVPGAVLQARAVSSLLLPPFRQFPLWATLLTGVLVALASVTARGFWGFVLAAGAVLLSAVLWLLNVQFPGVTVSLAAVVAALLVAAERWWQLRHTLTLDPLTGLGNRLAFTRAVEHRWATRAERPLGLLLVDLSGFRAMNELQGVQAGDALLRELAELMQGQRRRGDVVFRWGPDEFALLTESADPQDVARLAHSLYAALTRLGAAEGPVTASIGYAVTGPDILLPTDLVERASRMRYRQKYRGQESGEAGMAL